MRHLLILVMALAVATLGTAQNAQKPVPADSPVYRWLGALYTQQGLAVANRYQPYTAAQVGELLIPFDPQDPLVLAIQAALINRPQLTQALGDGPGLASATTWELNPELYWGVGTTSGSWTYAYNDRPPAVRLLTELWLFDGLYAGSDLQIKKDPFVVLDQAQPVSNVPDQVAQLDFQWPYWAGLVAGGLHWDARFFRSDASFAVSQWNLILSKDAGEVDQLALSTWWNDLSYTFLWVPLDNTKVSSWPATGYPSTAENDSSNVIPYDQSKNFIVHRLQFRPSPAWSVAVTELVMFEGAVFDPRYFNPLVPSHNWFVSLNANPDISLELEGSPLPGWTVWGQWYGDYIKTAFKDELYGDPTPAAFGYLAGTRMSGRLSGVVVTAEAEGVLTDPFLYLNNHVNMIKTWRYLSNYGTPGRRMIDTPLGFEGGPDTIAVRSEVSAESPGFWRANLGFPFQVKGENTIRTIHPLQQHAWSVAEEANPLYNHPELYQGLVTPTGTPEWKQGVTVGLEFQRQGLKSLGLLLGSSGQLGVQSTLSVIWNKGHVLAGPVLDWQSALMWRNAF